MTVSDLWDHFVKKSRARPSTLAWYESSRRVHVASALGLRRLFGVLGTAAVIVLFVVPAAQATPTIVSSWNMDETSGTTMFDQIDSNDGMLTGVTLGESGPTGGSDFSYGFNLTSVQSSVRVPNKASLNPGSADVSFTLHVNTTAVPGTGAFDFDLLRKGFNDGTNQTYKLEMTKGAKASCVFIGDVAKGVIKSVGGLNDGVWHTVTCAKTATTVSVTVNGVTTTKTISVGSISNTGDLFLGEKPDGTDLYIGLMDDVSLSIG